MAGNTSLSGEGAAQKHKEQAAVINYFVEVLARDELSS
jgi:hypothetical protein